MECLVCESRAFIFLIFPYKIFFAIKFLFFSVLIQKKYLILHVIVWCKNEIKIFKK